MELKRWLEELVKVEDSDLAALETVLCGAHPGGFDAYLEELEAEQGASQCNVVWTYGAIAYRCRDCQINDASLSLHQTPSPSTLPSLFLPQPHHHFSPSLPPPFSPACKRHRHQEHSADTPKPLPGNLGQVTETAVAAVVAQLVLQVGKAVKSPLQPPRDLLKLIAWLDKEGKAVNSPLQPPRDLLKHCSWCCRWGGEGGEIPAATPRDLLKLIAWLDKISHAAGIRDIVCARMAALLSLSLPVSTVQLLLETLSAMAEEVVTQEATLFLLLLYSPAFKNVFSALLIRQYPLLVLSVLPDHNPSARFIKIEKALDRVMAQLFNIPEVTMHWVLSGDSYWHHITLVLFLMSPYHTTPGNLHPLYSRPLHDMRLIFSHTPVVNYLLTQRLDCLADLLLTLSLLQGMNPYVRFEYGDVTEGRHPGMNPYGMNPYVRFEYGDPTEGTRWTKAVTLEVRIGRGVFGESAQGSDAELWGLLLVGACVGWGLVFPLN
ncbi:unnamed protein product [Closterium sp. NIES-64]|nr:unnamed protein product [Closterium sp. NIES-64]